MIIYEVSQSTRPVRGICINEVGEAETDPVFFQWRNEINTQLRAGSPYGRYFTFDWFRFPIGQPHIFDLESKESYPLIRAHPRAERLTGRVLDWHPDRKQALYWSEGGEALWLVDIQQGTFRVVAHDIQLFVEDATFSPDAQFIAYLDHHGPPSKLIYIISDRGEKIAQFADTGVSGNILEWSPDGKYLLYRSASSLHLIEPDGEPIISLARRYAWRQSPGNKWSPDGQSIVYAGDDGTAPLRCTLSPDPVIYDRCMFHGIGIYIHNVVTEEEIHLASGINPIWSPDGSLIAFISDRSGRPQVWIIHRDGSGLTQLTFGNPVEFNHLFWLPASQFAN